MPRKRWAVVKERIKQLSNRRLIKVLFTLGHNAGQLGFLKNMQYFILGMSPAQSWKILQIAEQQRSRRWHRCGRIYARLKTLLSRQQAPNRNLNILPAKPSQAITTKLFLAEIKSSNASNQRALTVCRHCFCSSRICKGGLVGLDRSLYGGWRASDFYFPRSGGVHSAVCMYQRLFGAKYWNYILTFFVILFHRRISKPWLLGKHRYERYYQQLFLALDTTRHVDACKLAEWIRYSWGIESPGHSFQGSNIVRCTQYRNDWLPRIWIAWATAYGIHRFNAL